MESVLIFVRCDDTANNASMRGKAALALGECRVLLVDGTVRFLTTTLWLEIPTQANTCGQLGF